MVRCLELVSSLGRPRRCKFGARYRCIRKSDGDVKEVCGTHRNQLLRYGKWKVEPI